jgi:hypothetical protein
LRNEDSVKSEFFEERRRKRNARSVDEKESTNTPRGASNALRDATNTADGDEEDGHDHKSGEVKGATSKPEQGKGVSECTDEMEGEGE